MKNISEWLASNGDCRAATSSRRTGAGIARRRSSWYRAPVSRDRIRRWSFQRRGHPGHLLVTAGRVGDTPVFDKAGERVGRVFDISIDKEHRQGHPCAARRRRVPRLRTALPSAALGAVHLRAGPARLRAALQPRARSRPRPALQRDDLEWCGAGYRSPFDHAYVNSFVDLPFA